MTLIYKILTPDQWRIVNDGGDWVGAPIDVKDGFIHFCTSDQLAGTLAAHFAGHASLILAAVETDHLGEELKWETSRNGAKFPHLYTILRKTNVLSTENIALGTDEVHILPSKLK